MSSDNAAGLLDDDRRSPSLLQSTDSSQSESEHLVLLDRRHLLTGQLAQSPYDMVLYLDRAVVHAELAYPDLAAGDAYRALLLTDEVLDDGLEYHEEALEALASYAAGPVPDVLKHGSLCSAVAVAADDTPMANGVKDEDAATARVGRLAEMASVRCFQVLSLSLLLCGCLKSASTFCERGLERAPRNRELLHTREHIRTVATRKLRRGHVSTGDLPDHGLVRREVYPWNHEEPDRFAPSSIDHLNERLATMAPKCEVRVAELPVLLGGEGEGEGEGEVEAESRAGGHDLMATCKQLGLFAREKIGPGERVLEEYSLLTAHNRLKDAVCDACSSELPPLGGQRQAVSCDECLDVAFCDDWCRQRAMEQYHPAVCGRDVDTVSKDPDPREADQTLYLLLLARLLAMASHQGVHPLQVDEVKYIWGDFVPSESNAIDISPNAGPPPEWTLPFSFKYNIEEPVHVLEKMGVDVYATLPQHDFWVLNTLYAKFRGTASARKSSRDGMPDVAAVHPFWCLANHDCDPNVSWEWGGRMVLWAREKRVVSGAAGGLRPGDEVLNHYCDVSLPVEERRQWAQGSLGGRCMCGRCRLESKDPTLRQSIES